MDLNEIWSNLSEQHRQRVENLAKRLHERRESDSETARLHEIAQRLLDIEGLEVAIMMVADPKGGLKSVDVRVFRPTDDSEQFDSITKELV